MTAMSQPTSDLTVKTYLQRALSIAGVGWVLLLVVAPLGKLLFAVPTAALLRGLLAASGNDIAGSGAQIAVGEQGMREVVWAWTAAPVVVLGLGAVLAYPADMLKKAMGVLVVLVNTVMVNTMVIGWLLVQTTVVIDTGGAVSYQDLFAGQLRWLYPPAMTSVLALSLLFWMWRVVPRPLFGGHKAVAGE